MAHPSHESQVPRLNKIEGQVRGISKMIENRRYCVDILSQIKAVTAALRQVELGILETHIQHCIHDAMTAKDSREIEYKIKEIMLLVKKSP